MFLAASFLYSFFSFFLLFFLLLFASLPLIILCFAVFLSVFSVFFTVFVSAVRCRLPLSRCHHSLCYAAVKTSCHIKCFAHITICFGENHFRFYLFILFSFLLLSLPDRVDDIESTPILDTGWITSNAIMYSVSGVLSCAVLYL